MRVIDLVKIPNSTKEVTKAMSFLLSPEFYASYFLRLRKIPRACSMLLLLLLSHVSRVRLCVTP